MMPLIAAVPILIASSYDADALNYFMRISDAGGAITLAERAAVQQFVTSAKRNEYWSYLVDCSPFSGSNTNAALVKLKRGGTSPWILTNNGFVSADYAAAGGFSGTGSAWLDTGFPCNQLPVTNAHGISVWLMDPMTNTTAGGEAAIGIDTSAQPYLALFDNYGASYEDTISFSIDGQLSQRGTRWGQGLHGVTRTALDLLTLYQNGAVIAQSSTTAAQAVPRSTTIAVFGLRTAGGASVILKHGLGWYAVDSGMPTNKLAAYFTDVRALMAALGRVATPTYPQQAFLIVGQSLAVGTLSGLELVTSNAGPTRGLSPGNALPPSVSVARFRGGRSYLTEVNVETGWRAFADHFIAKCRAGGYGETNNPLILNWAYGGAGYTTLKKDSIQTYEMYGLTTNWYTHSVYDVTNAASVQSRLIGNGVTVPAVFSVHGETDIYDTSYASYMHAWQANYEADAKAATGQTNRVPMFHSQTGNSVFPGGTNVVPNSNLGMLAIAETNTAHVLVCPKYFLAHGTDGVHLTNQTYRVLGEYYAEAAYMELVLGQRWEPVRPIEVLRTNAAIWLTFTGAVGSLTLDSNLVTEIDAFGFTYTDDSSPPAISGVALNSSNKVVVTLASTPTGANKMIRYSMNSTNTDTTRAYGGPTSGARGCLRDTNAVVGATSNSNLYNWAVVFQKTVP